MKNMILCAYIIALHTHILVHAASLDDMNKAQTAKEAHALAQTEYQQRQDQTNATDMQKLQEANNAKFLKLIHNGNARKVKKALANPELPITCLPSPVTLAVEISWQQVTKRDSAAKQRCFQTFEALKEKWPTVLKDSSILFDIVQEGYLNDRFDQESFDFFLRQGAKTTKEGSQETILHEAVLFSNPHAVKMTLEQGVVNQAAVSAQGQSFTNNPFANHLGLTPEERSTIAAVQQVTRNVVTSRLRPIFGAMPGADKAIIPLIVQYLPYQQYQP
jgi:hypothetical protein